MRPLTSVLALALAGTAAGAASPAPQAAPPAQSAPSPQRIDVTAAEVAVDFVARDRKGAIVRDLRPDEVEILEDGQRQSATSFRLVTTAPDAPLPARPEGAPTSPEAGAPEPDAQSESEDDRDALVALVFDRLSHEARRNACDAALGWLKLPAVRGRMVGVFRIDRGVEELQGFTDDRGPVMDALDDVLRAVPTAFSTSSDRERVRALRQQLAEVEGRQAGQAFAGSVSAAEGGAGLPIPGASDPLSPAERALARLHLTTELAMLQATEALERDQQGLATTNALLALVNGLRALPGRKAVVFFSEGLVVPERVASTLASVVSEANRGGVSFYAADAAGLRAISDAERQRRELAGTVGMLESARENQGGPLDRVPLTRLAERTADALRSDPAGGLEGLSRETGGFAIRDTNDIAAGLRRVEEDLGAYYLLSYAPPETSWDGRYRRIEVRVRRSGVSVQARRGYYAVRTPLPTPLLEHEAPVLARLEQKPDARELPVQVEALWFPAGDGEARIAVLAELPGGAPSLRPEEGGLAQDFTLLALVRDARGRVVHKASNRYALAWPKSKADEVRSGRVLFDRAAVLPSGRYTVEVIAYDALAGASGVGRAAVDAPAATPGALELSSLVVIGHAEPRALGAPGPLLYDGMQVFPTFGRAIRLGAGQPLAFLATLRAGARPPGDATVELLSGSEPVRSASVPLPGPDANGDVRLVGGLPLDGLAPGAYRLRLVVSDGRGMQARTVSLTLAP